MLDKQDMENMESASPERVYVLLMRYCLKRDRQFQIELDYALQNGFPLQKIHDTLSECFGPELAEVLYEAVLWRRDFVRNNNFDY
jgi:hypothetical protein